ncbi:MAG: protein kinase [Myxococcota bacterium]
MLDGLAPVAGYIPVRRLARGGMGEVQLAAKAQGTFRQLFAIKRLLPHLSGEAEYREMFLNEARLAALVNHPNVISVIDVGEDEHGPFLVMPFQPGLSLKRVLERAAKDDRPLPLRVALSVARDIAAGLSAAHTARDFQGNSLEIVHRDLSPHNVILGWSGDALLTDFGIAKAVGESKTTTGYLKGKVSYMSPEQLRMEKLDPRSDLFSLGIILVEMLTLERLYSVSSDSRGVACILDDPPPDLGDLRPDAPVELVELTFELLAKRREERPMSADHVRARFEDIMSLPEMESHASAAQFLEELAPDLHEDEWRMLKEAETQSAQHTRSRPSRGWWGAGAAVALIALGLAGWQWGHGENADAVPPSHAPTLANEVSVAPREAPAPGGTVSELEEPEPRAALREPAPMVAPSASSSVSPPPSMNRRSAPATEVNATPEAANERTPRASTRPVSEMRGALRRPRAPRPQPPAETRAAPPREPSPASSMWRVGW